MGRMKTTVDLDEDKLKRIMKITGIKTRKQAIDFALTEAERLAKVQELFRKSFYSDSPGDVVDPAYDLTRLREMEKGRVDSD